MDSRFNHDQAAQPARARVKTEAVYNARGIIAENYHDLQGLGVLAKAREQHPLPKASGESTIRAVFQSIEIALLNVANLMIRSAADIRGGAVGSAMVKLYWARGFHRLLVRLSIFPEQQGLLANADGQSGIIRIRDSPAFQEYVLAIRQFDRDLLSLIDACQFPLDRALAEFSLDRADFNLIHLVRVCNHESTIWERNLTEVRVPATVPSYEQFVLAGAMREAVYERVLTGDTYFTQFRGLHQVPEILGDEVNNRIEQAIRDLRGNRLEHSIEQLACADILTECILSSVPPMVDSLATSDYHQIRENLGLTSGSHSVCLRFDMFTDLYEQLWEEVSAQLTGMEKESLDGHAAQTAVRENAVTRFTNSRAWMLYLLTNYCLKLRAFIFSWRDEHLNLPRNNLGGSHTKSLTGSPDAVQAVRSMRDTARARDPMLPLARGRGLRAFEVGGQAGELTQYLESASSLDRHILDATGRTTQGRFEDVQERLGFFANRCPFTPPRRRQS